MFTLSLHGEKNFPFRKEASDLDVPLPDGCGDADYLAALDSALAELERRFTPGLVMYLAGADPFEGDRLGLGGPAARTCAVDGHGGRGLRRPAGRRGG